MAGFTAWLAHHEQQRTAIGDLARDWAQDSERPRVRTMKSMLKYLEECGASYDALETARKAWSAYEADRAAAPAIR